MNKYNNIKTVVDGIKFDSKREAYYYLYYKRLQENKIISDLKLQTTIKFDIDGKHIFTYKADFEYEDEYGHHYIDVKSPATEKNAVFRLKKKLIEAKYKIIIEIVK